ncbi:hypothetical protein TNCT_330861, partial [Trichonephila clavata]
SYDDAQSEAPFCNGALRYYWVKTKGNQQNLVGKVGNPNSLGTKISLPGKSSGLKVHVMVTNLTIMWWDLGRSSQEDFRALHGDI